MGELKLSYQRQHQLSPSSIQLKPLQLSLPIESDLKLMHTFTLNFVLKKERVIYCLRDQPQLFYSLQSSSSPSTPSLPPVESLKVVVWASIILSNILCSAALYRSHISKYEDLIIIRWIREGNGVMLEYMLFLYFPNRKWPYTWNSQDHTFAFFVHVLYNRINIQGKPKMYFHLNFSSTDDQNKIIYCTSVHIPIRI